MLALESKEMMDSRKKGEIVSTSIKSAFDSTLSDIAKSGIKSVKKPEGRAKERVKTTKSSVRKAATPPPPLMPEPETPKIVFSKPDPEQDPLEPLDIFGFGKNPVKTIVNKIVEVLTGAKEEPAVVKKERKGDHIYV